MSTEPGIRKGREVLVTFRETDTERFLYAVPTHPISVRLNGGTNYEDVLLAVLGDETMRQDYAHLKIEDIILNIPFEGKLVPVGLGDRIRSNYILVLTPAEAVKQTAYVETNGIKKKVGFAKPRIKRRDIFAEVMKKRVRNEDKIGGIY